MSQLLSGSPRRLHRGGGEKGLDATVEVKRKGDVVEGYKVLGELGRGAASIIYLVHDQRSKHVWALKHVEKENPKDQRFLDQAEAEYRVAADLDHIGIRKIERVIKKKRQLLAVKELYLVMELVDGAPLEKHPPETMLQAVDIFHQIAEALRHMHSRGYVHADMKPNNVVVSEKGVAKIIDLGQSCKVGTVKPRIQGTPDYIAPEQVHRRPITAQTDVYNLGATMYWVLTRTHIPTALPKGDSLMGSLDDNLIERPRPPVEINPRIHPRLNELIMKCVEVTPEQRPTMPEVVDRLNLIHSILRVEAERGRESTEPDEADEASRA
jgi:eukaryotic-like serine/threonine-protein kinase